jgi:hypothetical protein
MDNFEEAYLLTQTALKQLDNFVEHSRYSRIKMSLHMNLASRLLEAKYFDPHYIKQSKEIEELFNEQVEPSLSLCIENNWLDAFAVCLIRKGIFLNSNIEIYAGEKLLHLTNNLELIRLLKKDIEKYLHKGGNSNGNFN